MSIQIEAEKFLRSVPEKYPHLRGYNQTLIDAVVAELKSLGVYREDVTAQSFHVGLLAAMQTGTLPAVPAKVVERVVEKAPGPKPEPKLSPKQKQEAYAPMSTASGRRNHAHKAEGDPISERQQKIIIEATEANARAFVERNFNHPPTGNNHAVRERVRGGITAIIEAEAGDPIARWARTARRVQDEVLTEFEREIR